MAQVEAGLHAAKPCTSPARISLPDISELPLDAGPKVLPCRRRGFVHPKERIASISSCWVQAVDKKRKLEGQELTALQQAGLASGLTADSEQHARSKQRLSTAQDASYSSPVLLHRSPGNKENQQTADQEGACRPAAAELAKKPHQAQQLSRACSSEACSIRKAIQHHQRLLEAISCAPLACDASDIPSHADVSPETPSKLKC